ARLLEHRPGSDELSGGPPGVQLAPGDRRLQAVGETQRFPQSGALVQGTGSAHQGQMGESTAARRMRARAAPLAFAGLFLAAAACAQPYPTKSIRVIVAFAPGGIADFAARSVSQGLSENLRVPVVVENRPGAGGAIGAEVVAKAAPDGY